MQLYAGGELDLTTLRRVSPTPITSPVDFISGPRMGSSRELGRKGTPPPSPRSGRLTLLHPCLLEATCGHAARRDLCARGRRSPWTRRSRCAKRAGSPPARRRVALIATARAQAFTFCRTRHPARSPGCAGRALRAGRRVGRRQHADPPIALPACSTVLLMPPISSPFRTHRSRFDLDRVVEEAGPRSNRLVVGHLHRARSSARGRTGNARSPWRGRRARTLCRTPPGSRSPRRA